MAQITEYAYSKIREYALNNWKYIELQTPTGTPLKRFAIPNIEITINGQTVEYKVIATGAEFNGQTVGKSVLFDVATSGQPIATETLSDFTFGSTEDQLTVIHKLQIPQIV